jgi:ATP-binding cassette subfamily B protein
VGVIIIMFIMNVPLAIVSLLVMPLTVLITGQSPNVPAGYRDAQRALGELNGIIEETITGEARGQAFVRGATTQQFSAVKSIAESGAAPVFTSFMGPMMNMVNNFGPSRCLCGRLAGS